MSLAARSALALAGRALNTGSLLSTRLAGRAAYGMFGRPGGRGGPRPEEAAVLATAETGSLAVGGKSVRTYRWGDGRRPVLYVHGWRSRGSRVASHVPGLLSRGCSPVSFDAPGHGESGGGSTTIFEYREIIRALHARHGDFAAVIAHSLGAVPSLFSLRDTVRAERLVTIAGAAQYTYLLDAFAGMLRLRPAVTAELRRRLRAELFAGDEDAWRRADGTYLPEELDLPMLVVHDTTDRTVAVDQAHRLVAAYGSRARLIATYGLGHSRIVSDPAVVGEVLEFVTA